MRIERAQDKLDGYVGIPEDEVKAWQLKEVARLKALIEKYTRQLESKSWWTSQ